MTERHVTNEELRDAIGDTKEVLRAEAKAEHNKTRLIVGLLVAGTSAGGKAIAALGFLHWPFH